MIFAFILGMQHHCRVSARSGQPISRLEKESKRNREAFADGAIIFIILLGNEPEKIRQVRIHYSAS